MAWGDGNYIETRFGGMDCVSEPHTMDRDAGVMPDVMNLVARSSGLRTRNGWVEVDDLSGEYSELPVNAPVGLFLYDSGISGETIEDVPPVKDSGDGYISWADESDSGVSGFGGSHVPGNLRVRNKRKDSPAGERDPAWSLSLSSQSVKPYVPFALEISRTEGTIGIPSFLWAETNGRPVAFEAGPLVQTGANSWLRSVMLTSLDSRIGIVTLFSGPSALSTASVSCGYSMYEFFPDLPLYVLRNGEFVFRLICQGEGGVIPGYRGEGRGAVLSWSAADAEGEAADCKVTVLERSWSNGVMTGKARVECGENACSLNLSASFFSSVHLDSAVFRNAMISVRMPSSLHVFGEGGFMEVDVLPEGKTIAPGMVEAECSLNGSPVALNDVLELSEEESGSRIISFDSGWSEGKWKRKVRVRQNVMPGDLDVTVVLSEQGEYVYSTVSVNIVNSLVGTMSAALSVQTGVPFPVTAKLSCGNGEMLTRYFGTDMSFSAESVPQRQVSFDKDASVSDNWSVQDGMAVLNAACEISGVCEAVLHLNRNGESIAAANVSASSQNAALVEAVNERLYAAGVVDVRNYYDTTATASQLRQGAIDAMRGFLKSFSLEDGMISYSLYDNDNHGISEASETPEWFEDAYSKVITAVSRLGEASGPSVLSLVYETRSKSGSGLASTEAAAVASCSESFESAPYSSGQGGAAKAFALCTYEAGQQLYLARLHLTESKMALMHAPRMAATISVYGLSKAVSEGGGNLAFSLFGSDGIPSLGRCGLMQSYEQGTEEVVSTDWMAMRFGLVPSFDGYQEPCGVLFDVAYVKEDFHFEHK